MRAIADSSRSASSIKQSDSSRWWLGGVAVPDNCLRQTRNSNK